MADQFHVPSPQEISGRQPPEQPGSEIQLDLRYRYLFYSFRKRLLSLWGQHVDAFNDRREPVLHIYQKAFRLKEDLRIYGNPQHTEELLHIQARQIIDFSAAYDVFDRTDGSFVGTLRRKGWQSLARDEWEMLNPDQQLIARLQEDSMGMALVRRFALGSLLPASFHIEDLAGRHLATVRTRFNLLFTIMELAILRETATLNFDPRLFIAATSLLVLIEGKQGNYG